MKIKPLADRVLIQPTPAEETTISGIIIPDSAKEKPLRGTVIATGEGTKDEKMIVKEGDNVLYGKYAGTEVELDGGKFLIMRRAQRVFHTQVRIGAPLNITGLTDYAQEPYYSTAVGLLHYGKESHLNGEAEVEKRVTASVGSWIKRLNSWLRKEF